MDYAGKGLDSNGWNAISRYTTWIDGPGWDTVMVVDGYKIGNDKISGNRASVPVQYKAIGLIDGYTWYGLRDKNFTDEARLELNPTFELVKNNGKWLIKSRQFRPHVSVKVIIEHLKTLLPGSANDPEQRKELEKTINIINGFSKGKK
ncbi:MAG TPA: hypothetical protein VK568_09370 [Thermodesulfobacteriota bacterium]|jgi:hypothetical protein|nr:hypothetical protein [Thermodesulfobacteriota bacterium]